MKSRLLIWLSALALLILLVVQYIFVTETYRTKREQFDMKFGDLVKDGMIAFNNQRILHSFDSVLYLLDNLAVDYLFADTDTLEQTPGDAFQEVLDAYREPVYFLEEYIRETGAEPDFTYHVHIHELTLLDMGMERQAYPGRLLLPEPPTDALLAGSYTYQRNFFRISFDIYVSFLNRSILILQEMWLILLFDIFTLLFVFIVFYFTLRSMLLQKRLSDMKTDFISNMTHELKTPLSTIAVASSSLGNRSIIQKEDKVEELSMMIRKQNRHLAELIDRILDIHIWEKDQVRLKKVPVQVEKWIRELVSAFVMKHEKELPEITLNVETSGGVFLMDEVHISKVINNLLSNSVKYGNTPCRISVELVEQDKELSVSVKDNGPGIRREELRHIFEKFYRGEESRKRVVKGLGLGLYYVKQIVEAHRGTISVVSTRGEGAHFVIKIPSQNGSSAC